MRIIVIKDKGKSEVEIELKNRYRVRKKIEREMKDIKGVVEVEIV